VLNESGEEFSPAFEVVLVDPPYLSDECLTKTAMTIRKLATDKIILCTGIVGPILHVA
jgi:EEF1A lysine methyltransferase 1